MQGNGFNFDTTYISLPEQFFTELRPDAVRQPRMVLLNDVLAAEIGLDLSSLNEKEQAGLFSGDQLPEGATPFAQAYAGHQFGHFTMLGDGRAHVLGEHVTPEGERLDIQLKGSGRTPYSRRGDGKAALGPMLREYVISEAMDHLGIPTTRSLAVVTTGEEVMREGALPGAILTRVASSHIRVGTFEFAARHGGKESVHALMDYTIRRHYPELIDSENKALDLLEVVMDRQIDLVVHWMRVGFIHGVMNTDNMVLSGETIDYGPCAFMDAFDPATVFSSIDHQGRYAYANQPRIVQWNLARFAETLVPMMGDDVSKAVEAAEALLGTFPERYQKKWLSMMRCKLGLSGAEEGDQQLVSDLLEWMHKNHADYTNAFCDLSHPDGPTGELYKQKVFEGWAARWETRREKNAESLETSISLMRQANPTVIPRNHKVEEALAAAEEGDLQLMEDLLAALKTPYEGTDRLRDYLLPSEPSGRAYQTFCGT